MAKGKGVVSEAEVAVSADEGVDPEFNPPATVIRSDGYLKEYLAYYNGRIGDDIRVALAPKKVDYSKAREEDGRVYIAVQVLALGVHLPLPAFAREVLAFYHLAPTQISPGSWWVILGFAALGQSQNK